MTTPDSPQRSYTGRVETHGSPISVEGDRVALYTEHFAADPHRVYDEMRANYGPLVPVELAPGVSATLVVGYRTAVRILNDPEHFPADPRVWERNVPADSPILPMLGWRPNALRSAGMDHQRYRAANSAAIDGLDRYAMHVSVEHNAIRLINEFCETGSTELIGQYTMPLAFAALNTMIGCSAEIGQRVATGMAMIFEAGADAQDGNAMLAEALAEFVAYKRRNPGDDITSRLLAHEANLTDEEMLHQLTLLYAAGIEPQAQLIANTVLLMVTDDRFAGNVLTGSLSTRDAIDEVLFADPPMANFCATYPRQPILIGDVWLPAHQPVLISMTACNNDPDVRGDRTANRSHLSFSAGPHTCPARSVAYQIAQDAIDQLLDALPDLTLAIDIDELQWRPGPFQRALAALPVTFPKSAPLNIMGG